MTTGAGHLFPQLVRLSKFIFPSGRSLKDTWYVRHATFLGGGCGLSTGVQQLFLTPSSLDRLTG